MLLSKAVFLILYSNTKNNFHDELFIDYWPKKLTLKTANS